MVFQTSPDDLSFVIEVFGADEADDAVDEKRIKRRATPYARASSVS